MAGQFGLTSEYVRPDRLASDTAGKIPVMQDVLLHAEKKHRKRFDVLLDLDVTSPMRTAEDLSGALALLQSKEKALNLFSVSPARRNPSFNMVEKKADGFSVLVKPVGTVLSRQRAPEVFDVNASFYFFRRSFFDKGFQNAFTPFSLSYLLPHPCFDLDDPLDFEILEYLITHNKLSFSL